MLDVREAQRPGPRKAAAGQDIAIVGVGCRFPGGIRDLGALWRVFMEGVDVTGDIPVDRWGTQFFDPDPRKPGTTYCPKGGFLEDVDTFDAEFFGIAPREAQELDPQQRLLLETAWAAMEDSGIPRSRWEGSSTGVFTGILAMDYAVLHAKTAGVETINPYYASGKEFSFGAGRIAYTFDLHGPCVMVNTACSSSLMAVHLASQALRSGECDTALAGGVNLMLVPELSIFMSKIDALSPTGVCRPFDASADGVVRGEGCAVVVLKRYADAVADGDDILAVVKGSAANHDGRSAGLTAPNAAAQEMLLRSALASAGIEAGDVDYVEAHCTGTPLGDPLEISALSSVIGAGRPEERPLLVGSHKANFGHLDSAAGLLGLLKATLVARHGTVPPQIHLEQPTRMLTREGAGIRVATEPTALPGDGPRIVGVNAFGLSGSNVHVVLSTPPVPGSGPAAGQSEGAHEMVEPLPAGQAAGETDGAEAHEPLPILVLSGPNPQALTEQVTAHRDLLRDEAGAELPDLFYSASARRTHHDYRLAVVGRTRGELADALDAHLAGEPLKGTVSGDVLDGRPPRIVHVFSGQGSQWPGMGMDLYRTEPLVRRTLDECEALIQEFGGWSLLEEMGRTDRSRLLETRIAQPAIFALQLALTRLWTSWGVAPDAVVGHSMGEIAAACAAGALTVRDAARLVVERGRIMQDATGTGRMTAIEMSVEEAQAALEPYGGELCVATVNGPHSVVIAGPAEPMEKAVAQLKAAGATCLPLGVDYAFHSPAMRPFGDELEELFADLVPAAPTVRMLSSVTPDVEAPVVDASYWGRNIRDAVQLWPAVDRLLAKRDAVFVEIGPHPTLSRPLNAALSHRKRSGPVVASLARGKSGPVTMATGLAPLHTAGIPVDWSAVHGPAESRRYVKLPPLKLSGKSYWLAGVDRGQQGGSAATEGMWAEVRVFDRNGRLLTTTVGGQASPGAEASAAPLPVPSAVPAGAPQTAAAPAPVAAAAPPAEAAQPDQVNRGQIAKKISATVAEILGHDPRKRISRVRGFYELGLDSFTIVDMVKTLQAEYGVELGESAGVDHPTIDRMTDYLVAATAARAADPAARPAPEAPAAAAEAPAPVPVVAPAAPAPQPVPEPVRQAVYEEPRQAAPLELPAAAAPDGASPGAPEPIAVVGMGCRFPGANGLGEYWSLLSAGTDATRDLPESRWDADELLADGEVTPGTVVTRRGAFLEGVDQFDNAFFRISAREARSMDPQQRIFLEVAWEAIEDAGLDADALGGGRTGLFVGLNTTDYQQLVTRHAENVDLYYGTGNSFSGTAGRFSYFLGLQGPSLAVDTACSSSLAAVHLACQSLRTGESEVAVAGGSNVIATPTVYLAMSAGGALAADGRCKTFDAAADGYGRGEGAGAVVLKTLSRARADGDRVYAVIRGSAVNHDGASGGLTVPSAQAQEQVITDALAQSTLPPAAVDYVEAHGTGTTLGDAVELTALDRALGSGRSADRPLLVGAVKTNIGHLEAAAGVAGLIKTVLALHHGEIPAHLHYDNPTGQVAWDRLALTVTARPTPWQPDASGRPRVAGVSAFGFTGTNAHVVLGDPPPHPAKQQGANRARPFALTVSAASEAALRDAADRMRTHLEGVPDDAVADVCHSAGARRTHLEHRLAVTGGNRADLVRQLAASAALFPADGAKEPEAAAVDGVHRATAPVGEPVCCALAFGEGVADLPWEWFDTEEPAFRAALDAVEAEAGTLLGRSVRKELLSGGKDPVAVTTAQIALTALWRDHGIAFDTVTGHGTGEIAAAHAAGVLGTRDALLAASGVRSVRLSGQPAVPLLLASAAASGAELSAWVPQAGADSSVWTADLVAALVEQGVESVVDAGLGTAAAKLAAVVPDELTAVAADTAPGTDSLVRAVAELHVNGTAVDWPALLADRGDLVELPTYPWQHRRHWIDVPVLPSGNDGAGVHPDLGAPFTPFDAPALRYYPVRLLGRSAAGRVAVPRVAELALAAARDLLAAGPVRLRGLDLTVPLSDAADFASGAGAQLIARRGGAGWSLRLMAGAVPGRDAAQIATGTVDRAEPLPEDRAHADLDELRTRLDKSVNGGGTAPSGLLLDAAGPELLSVSQSGRRKRERLAVLRTGADAGRSPLAGGLLTAAVQLLASCSSRKEGTPVTVTGIAGIRVFEPPTGELTLHAVLSAPDLGDVRILAADGRVLADLEGVRFAPADGLVVDDDDRDRVAGQLYRIAWQPAADGGPLDPSPEGTWLVCAAGTGAAEPAGIADALRRTGAGKVVTAAGAADRDGWLELVRRHGPVSGLVLVSAGNSAEDAASYAGVKGALQAARALETLADSPAAPRLWLVTRGAQDPTGGMPPEADQAALWGLGRSLAMETPKVWGGLLDLEPEAGPDAADPVPAEPSETSAGFDAAARRMLAVPQSGPVEDELCLRGGVAYAPRLVKAPAPPNVLRPMDCRADAWYLVAGGRTEANHPLLAWLAGHGARKVLVVPDGDADGTPDEVAAQAQPLLPAGTELKVVPLAGDEPGAALDAALDGAPLGGVVLAPAPMVIRQLDRTEQQHLDADLSPVRLAGAVEAAVRGQRPDFVLVMGSAAASWGAVGMASRGAAEGALDAVAARAAAGLPVSVVRWMPRADTGELARRDRMLMEDSGLTPLEGVDVTGALDVVVRGGYTDACVARIDEARYAAACRSRQDRAFLDLLSAQDGSAAAEQEESADAFRTPLATELLALDAELRTERMLDIVLGHVVEVIGTDSGSEVSPDRGFFELGMDSVMSLALKTRLDRNLGGDLPTTLTIEYPTTRALARYLVDELGGEPEPVPGTAESAVDADAESDGLDELSDEELMDRLTAALADSESLFDERD